MSKKWVIADVHGCYHTLVALLNKVQPVSGDCLYFLGDYIDRGPHSKEVIQCIRELQRSDMYVVPLMGNHEESMIQTILEAKKTDAKWLGLFNKKQYHTRNAWYSFGGDKTMESFGLEDPAMIPSDCFEWLNQLQNYVIEENYLLSHAGFNFTIDNIFADPDSMRWIRDFEVDLKKTKGKKVIHGHVPVRLDLIRQTVETNVFNFIDLDNGCVFKSREGMGNLIAFELNTSELLVQPNIDF